MKLTSPEAEAFWPVYHHYEKELFVDMSIASEMPAIGVPKP